jgi:hypothetical protein
MRSVFIEAKNRKEAEDRCPWAAIIILVEGGYLAFESMQDYENWQNQK